MMEILKMAFCEHTFVDELEIVHTDHRWQRGICRDCKKVLWDVETEVRVYSK